MLWGTVARALSSPAAMSYVPSTNSRGLFRADALRLKEVSGQTSTEAGMGLHLSISLLLDWWTLSGVHRPRLLLYAAHFLMRNFHCRFHVYQAYQAQAGVTDPKARADGTTARKTQLNFHVDKASLVHLCNFSMYRR